MTAETEIINENQAPVVTENTVEAVETLGKGKEKEVAVPVEEKETVQQVEEEEDQSFRSK